MIALPPGINESDIFGASLDGMPTLKSFIYNKELNWNNDIPPLKKKKNSGTKRVGTWSAEEDKLLLEAVEKCKPILWDQVAQSVPGRNAIQCRDRYTFWIKPGVNKKEFEPWEDRIIIELQNKIGNCWTAIANKLNSRTSAAVKNRWYTVLSRKKPKYHHN